MGPYRRIARSVQHRCLLLRYDLRLEHRGVEDSGRIACISPRRIRITCTIRDRERVRVMEHDEAPVQRRFARATQAP
jgi:hypothetical protein